MKLNLVADFDVCGKRFVATFQIPACNNLVGLRGLTSLQFPTTNGGFVRLEPTTLQMCESKRKAEEVADAWEKDYKKQGRLYNYERIDIYDLYFYEQKREVVAA